MNVGNSFGIPVHTVGRYRIQSDFHDDQLIAMKQVGRPISFRSISPHEYFLQSCWKVQPYISSIFPKPFRGLLYVEGTNYNGFSTTKRGRRMLYRYAAWLYGEPSAGHSTQSPITYRAFLWTAEKLLALVNSALLLLMSSCAIWWSYSRYILFLNWTDPYRIQILPARKSSQHPLNVE